MSKFYDSKYKVGDKVEMFSARTGASVGIVGILERDFIVDEYPEVIIDGEYHNLCDEGDAYYLKKVLTERDESPHSWDFLKGAIYCFLILLLLSSGVCAQTWPTKDCPDVPYIIRGSDRIYHTCDCGVIIPRYFSIDPNGIYSGLKHNSLGLIFCPACDHFKDKEHIDNLAENGYIEKGKDGLWRLTEFGKDSKNANSSMFFITPVRSGK